MLEVYSAEWCGPCKQLKKVMDDNNIEYKVIDIDKEPDLARHAGVRGIPTTIHPETGQRLVGALTLTQVRSIMR